MGFGTSAIEEPVSNYHPVAGQGEPTITARHSALHNNNLLALPCVENRHTRYRGVGFKGAGIDGIVGADDEGDVCVWEVVVDFVHFEYDCEQINDILV